MKFLMVFLGGGIGAVLRYLTSILSQKVWPSSIFPIGTLISNVVSSTILILILTFWLSKLQNQYWQLLLITGLCGGYSTFSTFTYETFTLFKTGHTFWAIANVVVSVFVALVLIAVIAKKAF